MKKNIIGFVLVVIIIIAGIYFFTRSPSKTDVATNTTVATTTDNSQINPATTTPANGSKTVIGTSVEGREIDAYTYGSGDTNLLFVGGIHGGYEWNTALVAYQMMDYLKANPTAVPANVKVTVIPVLNPDGLNKVVGTTTGNFGVKDVAASTATVVAGRFNGNTVDLNRNFDCDWQANGVWQSKTVSGGDAAFSEPESLAFKNFVEAYKPTAVVVWYSSAGGVYSSSCHNGVSAETKALTQTFAKASGYPAFETFDFYAITGDMVNWLAKSNIPAISVLLTDHTSTESSKNQAGLQAVLQSYAK
ncbi:TPA: hypothetical protein DCQ44_03300 [Candidatus Taylorbacteria bacterium]|nr:hypothetical protein [Candidatus Taylorbacteria bacterium]